MTEEFERRRMLDLIRQLAETRVEDVTDIPSLEVAEHSLADLLARVHDTHEDRKEEAVQAALVDTGEFEQPLEIPFGELILRPDRKHGDEAVYVEWLEGRADGQRTGATQPCYRCQRPVGEDDPRLRVHSGRGKPTPRSHGRGHEYICKVCALADFNVIPPKATADWLRVKYD